MKATSKITKSALFAAILACLIVVGSGSAFAQQVFRDDPTKAVAHTDTCLSGIGCADWGESVSIAEPATAVPVVVIWSARYFVSTPDVYYAGLDVNHTGCQTGLFGPENLDDIATNPKGHFLTATFQWIVQPNDSINGMPALLPGTTNTFELCGGGDDLNPGDSISIGQNTLSVAKY